MARPADAGEPIPHLWQIMARSGEGVCLGGAMAVFRGAGSWSIDQVEMEPNAPLVVWRPSDGQPIDTKATPLPQATQFELYGLARLSNGPTLLGTSSGLALHLDRLSKLVWDQTEGRLEGAFEPPFESTATAYVAIPPAWEYKSGSINGVKLKIKSENGLLCFPLAADGTAFDLTFRKTG
jgi:hypothetical protein